LAHIINKKKDMYKCTCKNGKTWGSSNDGCNDNSSKCAQCCKGAYGGVGNIRGGGGTPTGGRGRGLKGFAGEEKYHNALGWQNLFAPHTLLTGSSGKNIFEPHTYLGGTSISSSILGKPDAPPPPPPPPAPAPAQAQAVPLEEETRIIEAHRIEREDTKAVLKEKLKSDIMNEMSLSLPSPESEGMSMGKKIGFGLAGVVVLVGIGYLLGGEKTKGRLPKTNRR
jgi:hypothetical protein